MAQASQFATALIDQTVEAINGSRTTASPTDGVDLLDNWLSVLSSGEVSTGPIPETISELKQRLQQGNPQVEEIRPLIQKLADQTHIAAQEADDDQQNALTELAAALRGFGQQLSGNQSEQSRQGDMDDPTGSNGGLSGTSSDADPADTSGAPRTGSPSVGGDRYGL